jgi:hypothetical protein
LEKGCPQSSFEKYRGSPCNVDPLEHELCDYVGKNDIEGIEKLLVSIKGVPGRAPLRKNAKKALKRIRLELYGPPSAEVDRAEETALDNTYTNRPGAVTPVAPTPELVAVLSLTHSKTPTDSVSKSRVNVATPKSECILNMAPLIVGWVIGKGGQRIRDMMEESGARIWIDQDSMGPNEPRHVHVSGQRKCVASAVSLIHDVVSKAPHGTVSESVSSVKGIHSGKHPVLPDDDDSPFARTGVVLEPRHQSGPLEVKHHRVDTSKGEAQHVLTCDPRFVPLLIGRRGWTIKHIQDTSLAWVDIDQNVTPRRITISGMKEHVDVAVGMVRDVLSYPEAQLQGFSEEQDKNVKPALVEETSPNEPPASPVLQKKGSHPSPPSSLIMTTDAQSTVSASSSLSSTPEPSMAPPRGSFAQTSLASRLPTMNGPHSGTSSEIRTASFDRVPLVRAGLIGEFPVYDHSDDPYLSVQVSAPFNRGLMQPNVVSGPVMQREMRSEGLSEPEQPFQLGNGPTMYQHHHMPHSISGPASQPNGFHLHSPHDPFVQSQAVRHAPIAGGMHRSHTDGAVGRPGLWNQPTRTQVTQESDGFRLDAAVDFLQHSMETRVNSIPEPVGSLLSTRSHTIGGGHVEVPQSAPGRDDSKMVDSFFGSVNENLLLSNLQGLSLGGVESGKVLWGSTQGDNRVRPAETARAPSSLFDARPTYPPHDQHPTHSRFAWSESPDF